jgi:hypothetical protein
VTRRAKAARRWIVAGVTSIALAGAVVAVGCASTSTQTAYTPYEGIDVPSSLVTAGVGCGVDAGIAYYATTLSPAAGGPPATCTGLPDPTTVIAASFVACFTTSAVFTVDAAQPLDVWVFGYAGGAPASVPCTDPTCVLSTSSDTAAPSDVRTLIADQADPATQATITLKCQADPELSQHPEAFNCVRCAPDGGPASSPLTSVDASDSATADGPAGDGSLGDGSLGDGSLGDGSLGDGSLGDGAVGDGSLGDGSSAVGEAGEADASTDAPAE